MEKNGGMIFFFNLGEVIRVEVDMERLGDEWDWGCESPKESIFKKLLNHTEKKKPDRFQCD